MKTVFLTLVSGLLTLAMAQQDIDQYLLSDSLEIQSLLVDTPEPENTPQINVNLYTNYGLGLRSFTRLTDLNRSLDTLGYGQIPDHALAWTFANQIDIGDHLSLGFSYITNYFIGSFNPGLSGSSKLAFFNFLIDMAYRQPLGKMTLAPESSFGIGSTLLSFKPNDVSEFTWAELHENQALVSSLNQTDFSLALGLGVSRTIPWLANKSRLIKLRAGMIFNPFSINSLGVNNGEWSFVKVTEAPEVSGSGYYFTITLGASAAK